jgi:hypothetical protein
VCTAHHAIVSPTPNVGGMLNDELTGGAATRLNNEFAFFLFALVQLSNPPE